ncbi:MAG: LarC family nickel insertion protein, partial [bacterium]
APATIEILKSYPTVLTNIPEELTTPTGAGIIKALSLGVLSDEVIQVGSIGYGAGTKEFTQLPNLLRLVIGEVESNIEQEQIVIVETNIDDMNPQIYPYLIEKLLASGAHDAYLVPIIMKKGRPGILLSVMVGTARLESITQIIYTHTSTIGVRIQKVDRTKLPRTHVEVPTSFGAVKAKSILRNGKEVLLPEFEESKRIAEEHHLSILQVMQQLERELSRK